MYASTINVGGFRKLPGAYVCKTDTNMPTTSLLLEQNGARAVDSNI